MQFTEVATIEKTYERSEAENLGINRTFLRRHCIDGSLKAVKSGTKYLIYWPNLLRLLENGDCVEGPKQRNGTRKVPERL
jgi:excisionase family DNA binding protein